MSALVCIYSDEIAHLFRLMLPCAVERHFPVVGATPTQHLSLRLVAALTHDGGNDVNMKY